MTTRYRSAVKETLSLPVIYTNWLGQDNSISVVSESGDKEMTDEVTPLFYSRIRDGEVINNACDYTETSYSWSAGEECNFSWWVYNKPLEVTRLTSGNVTARQLLVRAFHLYDVNTAPPITFDVDGQAKSFCLARVDSTPFEFFEDLAELKETIKFLQNPLNGIQNLMKVYKNRARQLRRKRWTYKYDEAKALADLWAQYSFALAPLVRSVMTACEAWDERDRLKRPSRRSAHGYSDSIESSVTEHWNRQPNAQQTRYKKTCVNKLDVHATIYYEVDNPLINWRFALGLRAKDIPVTVWQVMPLSFMLDRLVNVKNAISGLINFLDPSVTFLAASVTKRYQKEHTVSMDYVYWSVGTYVFGLSKPDHVKWTKFDYKRSLWTPSLVDLIPPFTPANLVSDTTKIADLIALIVSHALGSKSIKKVLY